MSKSNASAKNRRAYGGNPPPVPSTAPQQKQTPTQQQQPANGFTLQQVIAVIDRRLMNLESFVSENKDLPGRDQSKNVRFEANPPQEDNSVQEILEEYNNRFNMLAEELGELKEIVLKLQSYTMDVNKTLLEERIHILSDLGTNSSENEPQLFEISNNTEPETVNTTANIELQNLE
jgi:hypothetical protein